MSVVQPQAQASEAISLRQLAPWALIATGVLATILVAVYGLFGSAVIIAPEATFQMCRSVLGDELNAELFKATDSPLSPLIRALILEGRTTAFARLGIQAFLSWAVFGLAPAALGIGLLRAKTRR